ARARAIGVSLQLFESALLGLARDALEQALDFLVLLALAVGPFADHLLLGAHMRDQSLDRLCKIGHRGGGVAGGAAFLHGMALPPTRAWGSRSGACCTVEVAPPISSPAYSRTVVASQSSRSV